MPQPYVKIEPLENLDDIWNPTPRQIREWALDSGPLPDQDWELAVAEFKNFDLMIELANNQSLSKRQFFLGCLYVFVGDIVESKDLESRNKLKNLIEGLKDDELDIALKEWKVRSIDLIENDNLYSYEYWGLGSQYVYGYYD